MIRKYHNYKPQTTLWHREEESLNHHETPGRQIKQSNQLYLPHQDDCNTRTDTKQRTTKHRTITDSHNGSNNKQKIIHNRTTALERTSLVSNLRPRFCCYWSTRNLSQAATQNWQKRSWRQMAKGFKIFQYFFCLYMIFDWLSVSFR